MSPVSLRFGCPATVSPRFGRPDNVFPRFLLVLAVWPPFSHLSADSRVTLGRSSTFRPSGYRFPTFLPCFSHWPTAFPRSDRVTVLALCRPISTVTHVFGSSARFPAFQPWGKQLPTHFSISMWCVPTLPIRKTFILAFQTRDFRIVCHNRFHIIEYSYLVSHTWLSISRL